MQLPTLWIQCHGTAYFQGLPYTTYIYESPTLLADATKALLGAEAFYSLVFPSIIQEASSFNRVEVVSYERWDIKAGIEALDNPVIAHIWEVQ